MAKKGMQRKIDELQRTNTSSTQILDALRSDHQVPAILELLKDQEDLTLIADVATSPPAPQVGVSPLLETSEGMSQETAHSTARKDVRAIKEALAPDPSSLIHCWPTISCDRLMIKHLLSLYWTWIHPAYPLFSMECFVQDYRTGTHEHCSAFLVAAVCAAACDLLSPPLINATGKDLDVAMLRQRLVAEANMQEALADHAAQTTVEASQVMRIVKARSVTGRMSSTWAGERTERA